MEQLVAPVLDMSPASHGRQVLSLLAPRAVEYLPTAQGVHLDSETNPWAAP